MSKPQPYTPKGRPAVNPDHTSAVYHLVLWNDDVNTVDWVVETLMKVCNHSETQAGQCTLLAHYKGKAVVKTADKDTLLPMQKGLRERNLTVTIEKQKA